MSGIYAGLGEQCHHCNGDSRYNVHAEGNPTNSVFSCGRHLAAAIDNMAGLGPVTVKVAK